MTTVPSGTEDGWKPGFLAARAQSPFVYDRLFSFMFFLGATLLAVPVAFVLESLSSPGGLGSGKATYLWTFAVLAIWLMALMALYRARSLRQKQIGSLYYLGAQFQDDLDHDRVRDLIASSPTEPFDAPLRTHSDELRQGSNHHEMLSQIESNLRILLSTDAKESPTNLIVNLPWDLALALGTSVTDEMVQPEDFYIWHLMKKPENSDSFNWFFRLRAFDWFGKPPVPFVRSLVDVARGSELIDNPDQRRPQIIGSCTKHVASDGQSTNDALIRLNCTGREPSIPQKLASLSRWEASVTPDRTVRHTRLDAAEPVDPVDFANLVHDIADLILDVLQKHSGVVSVCATLPKPVAFAVGYCLRSTDLTRLQLARYDQATRKQPTYAYWPRIRRVGS